MRAQSSAIQTGDKPKKQNELWKNRYLYLMTLPALVIFTLFAYCPMPGIIIAFKDYNFVDGIFGSPWASNHGMGNFIRFFTSPAFGRVTFNTLWINFNNILWETIISVIFAVFLNEIRNRFLKKTFQFFMFLPYFFSAVIVGEFVYLIFNADHGVANQMITLMGGKAINWYMLPQYWVKILVSTHLWHHVGYTVIIYLAAITGMDNELYEAASIDGAGRMKQIRYILFPQLVPTIVLMLLLAIGRIFFGNFTLIWAITSDSGALIPTTDVIETYIYRSVTRTGLSEYGLMGAVGLYQSVIGFLLVYGSNMLAKKYDPDYALF